MPAGRSAARRFGRRHAAERQKAASAPFRLERLVGHTLSYLGDAPVGGAGEGGAGEPDGLPALIEPVDFVP